MTVSQLIELLKQFPADLPVQVGTFDPGQHEITVVSVEKTKDQDYVFLGDYQEPKMEFLKRAERYAEARGDEFWFKNLYTGFRQYNGVTDSVWKTLSYLYSDQVADLLEFQ